MSESVKVVVRCRPMSMREKQMGCKSVVSMDTSTCTCHLSNPAEPAAPCKSFRFDGVYGDSSVTENIYNEVAYPLIEGVAQGYNCTVFAYGQTGCGKSFTMQGVREQAGIIPLALGQLFEAAAVCEEAKFLFSASFLEIHNEEIRDLLSPQRPHKLELREHPEKGVYVHELSSHPVHSHEQCVALMERGWASRSVGATLMNADSSRSHSIFSVSVERMELRGDAETCSTGSIRRGKLNLVDLAGSERQAKTGASGERLKEATKINLSLSALGNVISALVDGRSKHIPYRDSKLTRLLQDSLGGNTKTLMVACLSPADYNYDETLSTLRYAHRAKSIENSPRVNEDPKDAMLRQYQNEIEQLRRLLDAGVGSGGESVQLESASTELRTRYEEQVEDLRAQCEAEQRSKEQLQQDLAALRSQYNSQVTQLATHRLQERSGHDTGTNHGSPTLSDDVKMMSPTGDHEESRCPTGMNLTAPQREVLARLQALQASMVGGELAHDHELKERRKRQLRVSERRLKALASALGRKDEEDAAVLQVYDDIEQELAAKSEALRRARAKNKAHEREIKDLQREFETERTDYLETIRRQDRHMKLFQQIIAKMIPALKQECNYSDLDKIKADATWNDDTQKWKLPDLIFSRTKLPPAAPTQLGGSHTPPQRGLIQPGGRAPSRTAPARIEPASPDHSSPSCSSPQDTLMQKLERSEQENLAGNYFKPKRATELLIKAQEECSRKATQQWKAEAVSRGRNAACGGSLLSTSLGSSSGGDSSLQQAISLAAAASLSSSATLLNTSWGNTNLAWTAPAFGLQTHSSSTNNNNESTRSPDFQQGSTVRKPTRLEALPMLDKLGNRKRAKAELNTMDIL